MLGDLDEDFPLNSGSEKLAKLFEENSLPDISFKFSVPKPPKPGHYKSQQKHVPLKVVYGKTVGAFQMKVDGYKSEGKLGLAIIGNDEFNYYQLYMYRSDERKVTSAEIHVNFNFLIQEHNYATFKDCHNIHWSVHFEKSSDLVAFSKEIALARWKSCQGGVKLIQEAFKGKTDIVVKKNDTLRVSYIIIPISPENILQEGVKKSITAPANSPTWETNLIGACVKSRRFVIIPSALCSSLDSSVPDGFNLLLDIEIDDIVPQNLSNSELPPQAAIVSNTSLSSANKKDNNELESLSGRMARIGYALPSLQATENNSVSTITEKEHVSNVSHEPSGPAMIPPPTPSSSFVSVNKNEKPPSVDSYDTTTSSHIISNDISSSSQFNVFLSELRTNNSEVRMNLNRVTDKVDTLLSKMDVFPQLNQTVVPAMDKIQNFESLLNKLVEKNNAIMMHLERNSPAQLEATLNEMVALKKRNKELESCLDVSASTCQILKDKVTELNEKLLEADKLKNTTDFGTCSLCHGGGERVIKSLEASVKNLQERNYDLLEASEQLEKQNRDLAQQLSMNVEKKLREQLREKELKISSLEREVHKLNNRLKRNPDREVVENEISDSVKSLMNKTYKMVKEKLKDCVKESVQLDPLLARILKEATAEHLRHEQISSHTPSSTLSRVEEESSESLDEIPRREDKSEQGNVTFSPSLTPLPVPRPRKSPTSDTKPNASTSLISNPQPSLLPTTPQTKPNEPQAVLSSEYSNEPQAVLSSEHPNKPQAILSSEHPNEQGDVSVNVGVQPSEQVGVTEPTQNSLPTLKSCLPSVNSEAVEPQVIQTREQLIHHSAILEKPTDNETENIPSPTCIDKNSATSSINEFREEYPKEKDVHILPATNPQECEKTFEETHCSNDGESTTKEVVNDLNSDLDKPKKSETVSSLFEPYSSSYYAPLFPTTPPPLIDD